MDSQGKPEKIVAEIPHSLPRGWRGLLWALFLMGVVAFLGGAAGPNRLRAWQIFLVNFLFWSGMAQGGLAFAATYRVTRARWGDAIKRLAEGMAAFLPISFLLFLVLFFGREVLFPWVRTPVSGKEAWLSFPFLFLRDGLSLLLLYSTGFAYLFFSLRPDVGGTGTRFSLLTRGWRGLEAERERSRRVLAVLAPTFLLVYTLVFSLLGFDLVMSLDPHWYSTLFGAYFFMSSFYLGLAALALLAALSPQGVKREGRIGQRQFHDLGKLLFGFCLVTGDFFWSQYVVIWYGNIPEETEYVLLRAQEMPWAPLSWTVLIMSFLGPFLLLLSRRVKETPPALASVASFIVVGMWLERYLLVVPSLWKGRTLPLGWVEIVITGGFFAAFALSYGSAVVRLPFPPPPREALATLPDHR